MSCLCPERWSRAGLDQRDQPSSSKKVCSKLQYNKCLVTWRQKRTTPHRHLCMAVVPVVVEPRCCHSILSEVKKINKCSSELLVMILTLWVDMLQRGFWCWLVSEANIEKRNETDYKMRSAVKENDPQLNKQRAGNGLYENNAVSFPLRMFHLCKY